MWTLDIPLHSFVIFDCPIVTLIILPILIILRRLAEKASDVAQSEYINKDKQSDLSDIFLKHISTIRKRFI